MPRFSVEDVQYADIWRATPPRLGLCFPPPPPPNFVVLAVGDCLRCLRGPESAAESLSVLKHRRNYQNVGGGGGISPSPYEILQGISDTFQTQPLSLFFSSLLA